ncbi:CPBP family intramembrane glutamic endopeptidase [Staphylococcus sp. Marseille-Q5304]|uniref:CPBP family intramembrane glutamic endopeptidase n=1 Tax=unclassified Staphylococcus TaxID=91994 RepID=UPI0020742E0D|nr:CPBP family intramembrane glutamic endopeptidase [Staphylococcus sp. Marseille-Q5304]
MKIRNNKKYGWKDIQWNDFSLILFYIFGLIFVSLISMIVVNSITGLKFNEKGESGHIRALLTDISVCILLILGWIILHKETYRRQIKQGLYNIKKNWKLIVMTLIIVIILKIVIGSLIDQFAPPQWQFKESENDQSISELLTGFWSKVFMFISVVIVAPLIEEFLFRHLLIGELGKKFNFVFMSIVSIVAFAYLHVTNAKSPLEIILYLIIGAALVFVYMKSNRSYATSVCLHSVYNLVSFIGMISISQ